MSEPTLTLPGTIPGLLRRGSPVLWRDEKTPYVVLWYGPWPDDDDVDNGAIVLAAPCSAPCLGVEDNASNFRLDLTDPTGGTHALWWLEGHSWSEILDACSALEVVTWQIGSAMEAVRHHPDGAGIDGGIGHHLDLLRRVILHIAGVDRG